MKNIDAEKLLDALDAIVSYNGLGGEILSWTELPKTSCGQIVPSKSCWSDDQLQVIWMLAVLLFGNYGTSPRGGWIEDVEGFIEFCKRITRLYQEEIALEALDWT